jgi:hypothetical protein
MRFRLLVVTGRNDGSEADSDAHTIEKAKRQRRLRSGPAANPEHMKSASAGSVIAFIDASHRPAAATL